MRKANSDFQTGFISEAGAGVMNNDYVGFVELDEYACYVVADGLHEMADAEGARLAIETIIQAFQEHPSLQKHVIQGYLSAANERLIRAEKKRISMKASVTVVVTNYEKMRYACAGNTRMYFYRNGETFKHSTDMSLAQTALEREDSARDLLSAHQERNNLYCYLGQRSGFEPYISEKIKLKESDIITLFTRGIWEHVDDGELQDVFGDATDVPQESVDIVEELLLARQPEYLENYTMAAIFVNKVFSNPKKRKKIKKILIIAAIVLLVAIILVVVLVLYQRNRQEKREAMTIAIENAVEFIGYDNYTKALEEAKTAYDLAVKLKDGNTQGETDDYIKLAESIIKADDLLKNGEYTDAQSAYQTALDYSMRLNQAGKEYIEKKLELTQKYMQFYDLIALGDSLAGLEEHSQALAQYREARDLAASLFFNDGKKLALDAMERVYSQMSEEEAAAEKLADAEKAAETAAEAAKKDAEETAAKESDAKKQEEEKKKEEEEKKKTEEAKSAADLLAQGDTYYGQGDYSAAKTYYNLARNKYIALGDATGTANANSKINLAEKKQEEIAAQKKLAEEYVLKGDGYYEARNYTDAKKNYTLAKQIYSNLSLSVEVAKVEEKLEEVAAAVEKQEAAALAKQKELERETQAAAELLVQGDAAYSGGNYISAQTYYQLALDKYEKIGDAPGKALAEIKLNQAKEAIEAENSGPDVYGMGLVYQSGREVRYGYQNLV